MSMDEFEKALDEYVSASATLTEDRQFGDGADCSISESLFAKKRETVLALHRAALVDADRLRQRAEHAEAHYQKTVRILTHIHALLHPPRVTAEDGRTFLFKSPMLDEQVQALSDRIRAIPDDLASIAGEHWPEQLAALDAAPEAVKVPDEIAYLVGQKNGVSSATVRHIVADVMRLNVALAANGEKV